MYVVFATVPAPTSSDADSLISTSGFLERSAFTEAFLLGDDDKDVDAADAVTATPVFDNDVEEVGCRGFC